MGALMICPVCKVELGVERRASELVLTYSFKDWAVGCLQRDQGSPALCSEFNPKLLTLLASGKAPSPRGEQRGE